MGTRSTYRVLEEWTNEKTNESGSKELLLMYVQFDGYPSGHPLDTAKWLSGGKVVNGISSEENDLTFNGAGCLAAQLVAMHKEGVGNTYIEALENRGDCWENYLYDIIVKEDRSIEYVCFENYDTINEIFRGSADDFIKKFSEVEENV